MKKLFICCIFLCVFISSNQAFSLTKQQQENIKFCANSTFDAVREYNLFPTTTKRLSVSDSTNVMRTAFTKQIMKKKISSFTDSLELCQQMYHHMISLHEMGYTLEQIKTELLDWE